MTIHSDTPYPTTSRRLEKVAITLFLASLIAYPISLLAVEFLAPGLIYTNYFGRHDVVSKTAQLLSIVGVFAAIVLGAVSSVMKTRHDTGNTGSENRRGPIAMRIALWTALALVGTFAHTMVTLLVHAGLR